MRELGFSKRQAREIAARGFKGASHEAPADEDTTEELAALLKRNLQLLERSLL